jgi:hypothetical protein
MPYTRLYYKVIAKVFVDGFSLGWRFDNDEGLTHLIGSKYNDYVSHIKLL